MHVDSIALKSCNYEKYQIQQMYRVQNIHTIILTVSFVTLRKIKINALDLFFTFFLWEALFKQIGRERGRGRGDRVLEGIVLS